MWRNEQEEDSSIFGWRSAGLQFDGNSVALSQMFHSGNYIFVMDGGIQYYDEYYPNRYIFFTKQGSMAWDTLKLPENAIPSVIYADSDDGLYIGTHTTGQVWRYNPSMETLDSLIKKDSLYVYGITRLNNRLVISMCDTWGNIKKSFCPIFIQQDDGTWEDITPASDILVFRNARDWHNDLFVITFNQGLWRFNSANKEWSQISINNQPNHSLLPSIEVYKDRLFVGYSSNGVWSLSDDYKTWNCEDFEWINYGCNPFFGCGNSIMRGNPMKVLVLKTNGEYLFSAGEDDSNPRLYMGDRGEPMGWRRISGDLCPKPGYGRCTFTRGLDIVGDTLYAAIKTGVYKIPIVELDSAIKNSDPYGRFPGMKPEVDSFPTPWVYEK
jgi:hypothetical protein